MQHIEELLVYKHLFNSETPFGTPEKSQFRFVCTPRIKSLSFEGLAYRIISEKPHSYVSEERTEQAIKSCHMKRTFTQYTKNQEDTQALFAMCEIALD